MLYAVVIFVGVLLGALISRFIDYNLSKKNNLYHFYVTFICVNSKGKRVYRSFDVSLRHLYPTEDEIQNLCRNVIVSNPEYKECAIMSWIRLGTDSLIEKKEEVSEEVESEE